MYTGALGRVDIVLAPGVFSFLAHSPQTRLPGTITATVKDPFMALGRLKYHHENTDALSVFFS